VENKTQRRWLLELLSSSRSIVGLVGGLVDQPLDWLAVVILENIEIPLRISTPTLAQKSAVVITEKHEEKSCIYFYISMLEPNPTQLMG